jgi:Protein of unknown function (DUF3102)
MRAAKRSTPTERAEARCAAQWKAFTAEEERKQADLDAIANGEMGDACVMAAMDAELTDLATRINDEHQAAAGALKQGVLHAIAAGDLLLKAKAQLKHGGWLDWLKANCEMPERTVRAYMRLARLPVEKRNAVADLPLREALSAIRSRQEKLERDEAAENRPHPRPAQICTAGPDGEVLFGKAALAAIPPQRPPSPPTTEEEIADDLIRQLAEALSCCPSVSIEGLRAAFNRRFPESETAEERDRKECVALYQKVLHAERELAIAKKKTLNK